MLLSLLINFIRNNIKVILWILVVIATLTVMYFHMKPKEPIKTSPIITDAVVNQTTTIDVVPKTSKNDNDLEFTQRYKANINGTLVEVPVVSKGTATTDTKAVVNQEIDMTKVINSALTIERERVKQEFKKNWELSTGIGIHKGDIYIPIELQRNYASDKGISFEIHLTPTIPPTVDGGEVKHTWKF